MYWNKINKKNKLTINNYRLDHTAVTRRMTYTCLVRLFRSWMAWIFVRVGKKRKAKTKQRRLFRFLMIKKCMWRKIKEIRNKYKRKKREMVKEKKKNFYTASIRDRRHTHSTSDMRRRKLFFALMLTQVDMWDARNAHPTTTVLEFFKYFYEWMIKKRVIWIKTFFGFYAAICGLNI